MSYIVKKANRVLTVPDEKVEEYQGMGYTVMDMSGNVISEPAPVGKEAANKIAELKEDLARAGNTLGAANEKIGKLEAENKDLTEKLEEASKYAENADKKIEELQKENEELKAAIQAQATMGEVVPDAPDSGKKTTTKGAKKSE